MAEGMPSCNTRIHEHAAKECAEEYVNQNRLGVALGAFLVDVDRHPFENLEKASFAQHTVELIPD